MFSQPSYAATIAENHVVGTPIGVTIVTTEAGDTGLDHPITLSIIGGGNTGGALAVDGSTGVVTLANPVDWETLTPNPIVVMVYVPFSCFRFGCVEGMLSNASSLAGDGR